MSMQGWEGLRETMRGEAGKGFFFRGVGRNQPVRLRLRRCVRRRRRRVCVCWTMIDGETGWWKWMKTTRESTVSCGVVTLGNLWVIMCSQIIGGFQESPETAYYLRLQKQSGFQESAYLQHFFGQWERFTCVQSSNLCPGVRDPKQSRVYELKPEFFACPPGLRLEP